MLEFRAAQELENILGGQGIDAIFRVLSFSVKLAAHRVRLAGASLTVGKACSHSPFENVLHKRSSRVLVH